MSHNAFSEHITLTNSYSTGFYCLYSMVSGLFFLGISVCANVYVSAPIVISCALSLIHCFSDFFPTQVGLILFYLISFFVLFFRSFPIF